MRPRTFILLILVLIVGAVAVVLFVANNSGSDGPLAGLLPGGSTIDTPADGTNAPDSQAEPNIPAPTATPAIRLESVVIAKVDLPIGTRITRDLLDTEDRPNTNIALQGNYTFAEIDDVVGQIARVDIAEGQAVLSPMLAVNASDLASFGSDLALLIDQNDVAVAFPINQLSGVAFAMRPGDLVDVLMTLRIIAIDPEFRTALPNLIQYVIEPELRVGGNFLLESTTPQGRLEFIEEIGQVAEIVPSAVSLEGQDFEAGSPIPKRVTQLTIQQAEVLWVGSWKDQDELAKANQEEEVVPAEAVLSEEGQAAPSEPEAESCLHPESGNLVPCPIIRARKGLPDVVILGMSSQDALALKYALERGIDIDLALRSQGDGDIFITASVTLPQIVEQGGLNIPPPADFDLHPRPDDILRPFLPATPPED